MSDFKAFCKKVLSKNNRDWQFGRRLPGAMAKLNLNDIHAYVHAPCLTTEEQKRLYEISIKTYADMMSAEGFADDVINKLLVALKLFCENETSYCYGFLSTMFASGRKAQ